jgi:hypothetical protein
VPHFRNIAWQARALWTRLSSTFKHEWTMDDYPIRVWFQPTTESSNKSRLKALQWRADVINWPGMSGSANSRQEALGELRRNFDRFKATNPSLPRPGTKVPIQFAPKDRIDRHPELEKDFVKRVLEIDWAWISDESSLGDFHEDETNKRLNDKIRRVYGVDVSDISSGNLADIFERIAKSKVAEDLPAQ